VDLLKMTARAFLVCFVAAGALPAQTAPPRIVTFGSEQISGGSRLYWTVENAEIVRITGVGAVSPSGTAVVSPSRFSIYTLTARSAGGVVAAKVSVVGIVPVPGPFRGPGLLNFFDVEVGASATLVISITGIGRRDAEVVLRTAAGTPSAVYSVIGPRVYRSATDIDVPIEFKPPAPGVFRASVDIKTQDFVDTVELRGGGVAGGAVRVTGILNAASYGARIASNTWVSVIGQGLTPVTRAWTSSDFDGDRIPVSLSGTSILIGDKPGYISYISPTQINVLLPPGLALGLAEAVVRSPAGQSNPFTLEIKARAPAPFLLSLANGYVVGTFIDGALLGPADFPGQAASRPAREDDIVALYLTGVGKTTPEYPDGTLVWEPLNTSEDLNIWIGEHIVDVLYAVLISPGLYQVGIRVPLDPPAGNQRIFIEVTGDSAEGINVIPIHQ
jgi:uncharacterized protein (TIGR03437 family)